MATLRVVSGIHKRWQHEGILCSWCYQRFFCSEVHEVLRQYFWGYPLAKITYVLVQVIKESYNQFMSESAQKIIDMEIPGYQDYEGNSLYKKAKETMQPGEDIADAVARVVKEYEEKEKEFDDAVEKEEMDEMRVYLRDKEKHGYGDPNNPPPLALR